MTRRVSLSLALLSLVVGSATATAQPSTDELMAKGDYYFKAGYYFKASESYRLALLEDPTSPVKKLAFGHALFAIGNYNYASYALRRAVAELDPNQQFHADVAGLFPARRKFKQAERDLKRYVTYNPRDPAGLSVLGYVLFAIDGEERRCRDMFHYLKRLDPDDPFAAFFLKQLQRRARSQTRPFPEADALPADEPHDPHEYEDKREPVPPPAPVDVPRPTDEVPQPTDEPPAPGPPTPLEKVIPKPTRQGAELEQEWPAPTPAPAR